MKNDKKKRKEILLIDDDASLLVTLSDFLKYEGYEVITADSGEKGLERLKEMIPDLIILDMSMPGMGGIGFLKEISSIEGKPEYPVLVLTARANMAEFFADVDVDGFIAKPCEPNDLLMEVSRIIFLRSNTERDQSHTGKDVVKVIIGEDDKTVNSRLADQLASASYQVVNVFKGTDVLEKAIIEKPDIIVMNYILTGMNGDAVARMLTEMPHTKKIPVILYNNDADFLESKYMDSKTGIKKLVKSDDSGDIIAAIKEVLGK
jgi:CheY-like chemotaxis protein